MPGRLLISIVVALIWALSACSGLPLTIDDDQADRSSGNAASGDASDERDGQEAADDDYDDRRDSDDDSDSQTTSKRPLINSVDTCEEQVNALSTWIQDDMRSCTQNSDCQLLLAPSIKCLDG